MQPSENIFAYRLRRSQIDPDFLEVVQEEIVVQEIRFRLNLRNPPSFATLNEIEIWLHEYEWKRAKGAAYRLIAGRSFSKAGLLQKLRAKKFSPAVCEKVVCELEKLGYLSDADFTEQLIAKKIRQGYGPRYIERVLQEQGLDASRLQMKQEAQAMAIRKWLAKKRGIPFLLRKGFDFALIQREISCK